MAVQIGASRGCARRHDVTAKVDTCHDTRHKRGVLTRLCVMRHDCLKLVLARLLLAIDCVLVRDDGCNERTPDGRVFTRHFSNVLGVVAARLEQTKRSCLTMAGTMQEHVCE